MASYEAVSDELAAVKKRIAANEERLAEAEAELGSARQIAADRAAAMYKERQLTFVDVIVGSNDFGDLLAQVQFFARLGQHDRGIVADLEDLPHLETRGVLQMTTGKLGDPLLIRVHPVPSRR